MNNTSKRIKIGLVTMQAEPWALEQNYLRLEAFVREAAQRGAEVVVAPETILDGYVCSAATPVTRQRMLDVAQTVPDGPYIVRARELSRDLGIHLVFGFLERVGEEMFNTVVLIDPEGEVLARYSKVHPKNEVYITPGRALKPTDTPLGRVGFLICMDRGIPENFRTLGVQGVEIVFLPMDGEGSAENTRNMAQRAAENGCWVIVANTWSCTIVNPQGHIKVEQYEGEKVTIGHVDLSEVPRGLNRANILGRRPDLYGPLLESIEPVRWYDERGYPTVFAEQEREALVERVNRSAEDATD